MEGDLKPLFRGRNAKILVPAILGIVDELKEWWPLTVRQVYYQLVSRELIPNRLGEYQNVSSVLTKLRRNNLLSWTVIEDRSRRIIDKRGVPDLEAHITENAQVLFHGYDRCLVQNQEQYVEIWTEKDALTGIIHEACWIYCTRIVVVRGQSSSTYIQKYATRGQNAQLRKQRPVILYVGDYDPSGLKIPEAIVKSLNHHHGLKVDLHRIALTRQQIDEYNVPASIEAVKTTDPNYGWFRSQGHDMAAELDALHPAVLKDIVVGALSEHLDIEDMVQQQDIQKHERETLRRLERFFAKACQEMGIRYCLSEA